MHFGVGREFERIENAKAPPNSRQDSLQTLRASERRSPSSQVDRVDRKIEHVTHSTVRWLAGSDVGGFVDGG